MSRSTIARRVLAGAAVAGVALVAVAAPAGAHVSIAESEVAAGARATLTFGFGHGCDDSPTTKLRIQIPEAVPAPQPVLQAGWGIEVVREPLAEPVEVGHGETVSERVSEIVFTADEPVPGDFRASVQVSFTAPEEVGETLYFPVVQECSEGATNWTQIPAEGQDPEELESPAPGVTITEAEGDDHGHGGTAETTETTAAEDAGGGTTTAGDDESDDDDGGSGNGLAIAGIAVGVVGLGVGGRALAAVSELKKREP